jgi:hypothetical protein
MRGVFTTLTASLLLISLGCADLNKALNDAAKGVDKAAQEATVAAKKAMDKESGTPTTAPTPAPAPTPTPAPAPAPAPTPAPPPAEKENFQGHFLSVWIDGKPTTRTDRKDLNETVWTVDACGGNPEVRFQMDAAHLGAFKEADVVINPLKGEAGDPTDLWHDPRVRKELKPDQGFKLGPFQHIAGGQLASVPALPPGRYALKVQVNGEKNWDRQVVHVTVK